MSSRRTSEYTFRPAWWVPGPHAQTLWAKFLRRAPRLTTRTVRVDTPDGDFLDIVRLDAPPRAPRLFLLHGLEGTERSQYVGGFLRLAAERNWGADVLLFRGCGDEPNRAARFYHSGETTDLDFALSRTLTEFPDADVVLAGVSLGGNVLLKWLGEHGAFLSRRIRGAAAVSVPFDLERGSRRIGRGFSRVYQAHFLRSLRRKALAKLERFPGLFDAGAARRARSMYDFDDVVTAPVHGFRDAHDYYARSSALRWLERIRLPTLLLSAVDDPFLPAAVLDDVERAVEHNTSIHVEFLDHGGHVGFVGGTVPWRPFYYAEWRAMNFLAHALA
jgi:uncharacterized protein